MPDDEEFDESAVDVVAARGQGFPLPDSGKQHQKERRARKFGELLDGIDLDEEVARWMQRVSMLVSFGLALSTCTTGLRYSSRTRVHSWG